MTIPKPRIIVVTGIPGVGKSTVLDELRKMAIAKGKKVNLVNFGTVMLDIIRRRGLKLHRDEIRLKPVEFQREIQLEAAREIARMAGGVETLVVDTHMVVKTRDGYWPGLPSYVLDELKPDLFVLIEAEPEEVTKRRVVDVSRIREDVILLQVKEELEFSRWIASSCSVAVGVPIRIIKNPNGRQVEAAKELLEVCKI